MHTGFLAGRGRRFAAAVPLVAVLTMSAGCDLAVSGHREEFQDTWTRTYTLTEGGRLDIENTNGFIDVSVGTGNAVQVSVQRVAKAASEEAAKELLSKVAMKEEITPERVHLYSERPRQGFSMGGGVELRYTVKVPASAQVELTNTNGRVSVVGRQGRRGHRDDQRRDLRAEPRRHAEGDDDQRRHRGGAGVARRRRAARDDQRRRHREAARRTPRPHSPPAAPTAASTSRASPSRKSRSRAAGSRRA